MRPQRGASLLIISTVGKTNTMNLVEHWQWSQSAKTNTVNGCKKKEGILWSYSNKQRLPSLYAETKWHTTLHFDEASGAFLHSNQPTLQLPARELIELGQVQVHCQDRGAVYLAPVTAEVIDPSRQWWICVDIPRSVRRGCSGTVPVCRIRCQYRGAQVTMCGMSERCSRHHDELHNAACMAMHNCNCKLDFRFTSKYVNWTQSLKLGKVRTMSSS